MTALVLILLLIPAVVHADINPWIRSAVYNPAEWDTAGAQTATPWLHPLGYKSGQGWGMLAPESALRTGRWRDFSNITGSWGGARDELVKRGVSVAAAYFGQFASNSVGGEREGGASFRGDFAVGVFLDLQRILELQRTYFTVSFDWKAGTNSLSTTYVGNQFPVQLDSFDDSSVPRLVHLAFGVQLFDNTAELVGGRLITGEDFATLRLACTSLNQALCGNPINAAQNISFPTFPNAVWGGRFKLQPGKQWYAQVGSYLIFPDFNDGSLNGVEFGAPKGSAALTLAELGYVAGSGPGILSLPGIYKIGGYYDTEEVTDQETQDSVRGTGGFYVMGEQKLWPRDKNPNMGLSTWLSLSYAPPDRNPIEFMAAGGFLYNGLPWRKGDGLAFVFAYGQFSGDLRSGERASGEFVQRGELLLEVNYRYTIGSWLWLEPDIQGIIQPNGQSNIPDAFIAGIAIGFVL